MRKASIVIGLLLGLLLIAGCASPANRVAIADRATPGAGHPFLLFSAADIPAVKRRENADPLLKAWMENIRLVAERTPDDKYFDWKDTLEDRAFLATLDHDPAQTQRAIAFLQAMLREHEVEAFLKKEKANWYGAPQRAFALAWDWLEPQMTPQQKSEILPMVRAWCVGAFEYTEKQWWRDGSYNVGADPVSGNGLLALSICNDVHDPVVTHCLWEDTRRIGQNYFPMVWKPSGICYEGPGYAKAGLNQAIIFAQALRRSDGEDLTQGSGAMYAMNYLMYQYMPSGGCAPIGDNTGFGRSTFVSQYLLGIGQTHDAEGLWAWCNHANPRWLDTLIGYLWYPLDLTPRSPKDANLPTSKYFEVTPNRAGYVFSRSAWGDKDAAFFAFTTRFELCNHQHYDMDSILFGGFGTLFATHELLFPYSSENHGVDYEHNIITIDGGGWPAHREGSLSCAIENSRDGLLVGLSLSNFADYVRGDAKGSYHDDSVLTSELAVRAERSCLFVKQGPTPYLLVVDDNQQSGSPVKYDWLWHAPQLPMRGAGTLADPLTITAKEGSCAIQFITPARPAPTTQIVIPEPDKQVPEGASTMPTTTPSATMPTTTTSITLSPPAIAVNTSKRSIAITLSETSTSTTVPPSGMSAAAATSRPSGDSTAMNASSTTAPSSTGPTTHPTTRAARKDPRLKPQTCITVEQTGVRVHYAMIASVQGNGTPEPSVSVQPVECRTPAASAVTVDLSDGSRDWIAWQSEENLIQRGRPLTAGAMQTDGLMAMVRVAHGKVIGFVLGEGTYLRFGDQWLVKADSSVNVSVGANDRQISGRLRTRQALPPESPGKISVMRLEADAAGH